MSPSSRGSRPSPEEITLAVVTRDRSHLFAKYLLPSLREAAATGVPILVVDQSRGPQTADLVRGIEGIRYLRSGPGIARGRNVAVGAVNTPLLAFTDDDVTFGPRWMPGILAIFRAVPEAGAVCGRAVSPSGRLLPGSDSGVYVWPASPFGLGSGFNLAFRREALAAVGSFDEELGAGGRFGAGEDTDMLYRIMRAGWPVVCSDEITVTHMDWRSPTEEVRVHYRYGVGAGAQTAKHSAAGDKTAAQIAVAEARSHLWWLARRTAMLQFRAASRQVAFLGGLAAGYVRGRWGNGDRPETA
jgi:GT2 family glycosyltransferase